MVMAMDGGVEGWRGDGYARASAIYFILFPSPSLGSAKGGAIAMVDMSSY